MARKTHIIVVRWASAPKADDLQKTLPGTWLRFNSGVWLLKSSLSSEQIDDRINREGLGIDEIMIIELLPDTKYGWAEQWIWEWIDKD